MWIDELYSQTYTIDVLGFLGILRIEFTEGNLCPLFYLVQEAISRVFNYTFPLDWHQEWCVYELNSQLILRIAPNIFMSLSIVLFFWYFSVAYSFRAGFLSLITALSSFVLWAYWAEARPYALWFLLTTIQSLIFLHMLTQPEKASKSWLGLCLVHFLLSLTIVFSAVQIFFMSIFLMILIEKDWRKYVLLTVVPLGVCYFYYYQSHRVYTFLSYNPLETATTMVSSIFVNAGKHNITNSSVITMNTPLLWIILYIGYVLFLFKNFAQRNKEQKCFMAEKSIKEARIFIFYMTALLITAAGILSLIIKWISEGIGGYSITERHFIFLAPVGIITFTLVVLNLYRTFQDKPWLRMNLVIVVGGIFLLVYMQSLAQLTSLGLFW